MHNNGLDLLEVHCFFNFLSQNYQILRFAQYDRLLVLLRTWMGCYDTITTPPKPPLDMPSQPP